MKEKETDMDVVLCHFEKISNCYVICVTFPFIIVKCHKYGHVLMTENRTLR